MWEDDPINQQQNFRTLLGGGVLVVLVGFVVGLIYGNWEPFIEILRGLAGIALGLAIYAAAAWIFVISGKRGVNWWRNRGSGNAQHSCQTPREAGS